VHIHAERIRHLIREGGFHGRGVILGAPHNATRIKNFRLPRMPEEELSEAVRFEALERFQGLDDEPEIRFFNAGEVQSGQGEQFELIVIAVRGDVIRGYLEALGDCGLCCESIDFAPAAGFRPFERFLKRTEDVDRVNVFLDIGFGGSRLVLTRGTDMAFVKVFDLGTDIIEAAVANGLSIEREAARELWRAAAEPEGEDVEDPRKPAVAAAVAEPLAKLGKEISLCLRYFSVTFRGLHADGITCVGGGARNALLRERLSETVQLPVRIGHPMRGLATDQVFTGADRRSGQPEWTTVVGLAMKGLALDRSANVEAREAVRT
jgi:type IV pilus assembly protein PilM